MFKSFLLVWSLGMFLRKATTALSSGTSGRLTLVSIDRNRSLEFLITSDQVRVLIQNEKVKLTKCQLSSESKIDAAFYWSSNTPLPSSPETGYTITVKIQPSANSCAKLKLVDIRTTVISDNGEQTTFAVASSALNNVFDCDSIMEKNFQLTPINDKDCVMPLETNRQSGESTSFFLSVMSTITDNIIFITDKIAISLILILLSLSLSMITLPLLLITLLLSLSLMTILLSLIRYQYHISVTMQSLL